MLVMLSPSATRAQIAIVISGVLPDATHLRQIGKASKHLTVPKELLALIKS